MTGGGGDDESSAVSRASRSHVQRNRDSLLIPPRPRGAGADANVAGAREHWTT